MLALLTVLLHTQVRSTVHIHSSSISSRMLQLQMVQLLLKVSVKSKSCFVSLMQVGIQHAVHHCCFVL